MRNLTIKRIKSFVGCLGKMKIYIEDSSSDEIVINGISCKKLGELKNGEEKTFSVTEQSAKVFVIADALSKSFCNEYYQLPDGNEDISLSGKNKFNPAAGNAFRFDNNDTAEVLANRKKGKGKGAVVLAIALAIGIFAGSLIGSYIVNIGNKQPKTFSCNEISITLTKEFRDFDYSDGVYDFVYETKKVCVFGLKEKFSEFPEVKDFTVEEYGNFLIIINELKDTELEEENGITSFEYDAYNSEVDSYYHYYVCLYPRDDAFWVVQFATLSKDFEKYRSDIAEWARSVDFSS
ncbi:MAG: hypothetical protein J6C89_04140 [Clostridia bacterium]|nr:hypothetical protein [Clostridia bacterium]